MMNLNLLLFLIYVFEKKSVSEEIFVNFRLSEVHNFLIDLLNTGKYQFAYYYHYYP